MRLEQVVKDTHGRVLATDFCSHRPALTAWAGCSFCQEAQKWLDGITEAKGGN